MRLQPVEVERVAPDQEEAAHRVGDVPQAREKRQRSARRDARHRLAGTAERPDLAAGAEPARDDHLEAVAVGLERACPRSPRAGAGGRRPSRRPTRPRADPDARHDRAAEAALALGRRIGAAAAPAVRTRSAGSPRACRRRCRRRRSARLACPGALSSRAAIASTLPASSFVGEHDRHQRRLAGQQTRCAPARRGPLRCVRRWPPSAAEADSRTVAKCIPLISAATRGRRVRTVILRPHAEPLVHNPCPVPW